MPPRMTEKEAIRELATIQAHIIRRLGTLLGSPSIWRKTFNKTVKVMEEMNRQIKEKE